jgi:hypothetical protein
MSRNIKLFLAITVPLLIVLFLIIWLWGASLERQQRRSEGERVTLEQKRLRALSKPFDTKVLSEPWYVAIDRTLLKAGVLPLTIPAERGVTNPFIEGGFVEPKKTR